jgi:hypothetical protein
LNALEEHIENVPSPVNKLQETGHYLKMSKCKFGMQRIAFVSFVITLEMVRMKPNCVTTIAEWQEPESRRDIKVILSFAQFLSGIPAVAVPSPCSVSSIL